jgi:hypothetical protein
MQVNVAYRDVLFVTILSAVETFEM